ncbi:MAG: FAD:protein FMN transferase [Pseudomonadota bacterium]
MTISRRRFLAISAAALVGSRVIAAQIHRIGFRALGADCEITLPGDAERAHAAVAEIQAALGRIERSFSLWDARSELSRLNETGILTNASPEFLHGWKMAMELSRRTEGSFDVTVQPLWEAAANRTEITTPIGWHRVQMTRSSVGFRDPGMRATFNGLAQGIAADRAIAILEAHGYVDALANLGEYRVLGDHPDGRHWQIGVHDPINGGIAAILEPDPHRSAVATSEPRGTLIAGTPHIFDPLRRTGDRWASVTVLAATAAWADGVSTAIAAAPMDHANDILAGTGINDAVLIDRSGQVRHWRG